MAGESQPSGGVWSALGWLPLAALVLALGAFALAVIYLIEIAARLGGLWNRAERWVLGLTMGALAALVAAQALAQVFHIGATWVEEVCVLAMALAVWLGLPHLLATRDLLSVEFGPIARLRAARAIAAVATALFLVLVTLLAFDAMPPWSLRTDTLRIPRRLLWGLVPLAALLSLAATISRHTEREASFRFDIGSSLPPSLRRARGG